MTNANSGIYYSVCLYCSILQKKTKGESYNEVEYEIFTASFESEYFFSIVSSHISIIIIILSSVFVTSGMVLKLNVSLRQSQQTLTVLSA